MALFRCSSGGGGTSYSSYSNATTDVSTAANTKTIMNQNGKVLLLFAFQYTNQAKLAYDRLGTISVSNGTATFICYLLSANDYVTGAFFVLKPTSDQCTIQCANPMRIITFEAE